MAGRAALSGEDPLAQSWVETGTVTPCNAFACTRHRAEDRQICSTKGRFRPPYERVLMFKKEMSDSEKEEIKTS